MAMMLDPGEVVNGYTIKKRISTGAMAVAYEARNAAGERVFFKQYKSPACLLSWYKAYVEYQQELKRRIETSMARNFTYRFIDFFEAKAGPRTFFQVFEFVEGGNDLEGILLGARNRPASLAWEQRVTLAKVMMAGVHALHDARIVHCDLKPANLCLFADDSISAGYRLKVIDMDFSLLTDRKAPWDGFEGYVGSPSYYSPEHLLGQAPGVASDVFTCGLILYELLAQGHPYLFDDEDAYRSGVLGHTAARPRLQGRLPKSKGNPDNDQVEEYLYRCLNPVPGDRPKATDILAALNGVLGGPIHLSSGNGQVIHANLDLTVGRGNARVLGEDSQFLDEAQFKLVRVEGAGWFVEPNPQARNETLLNRKAITARTLLKNDDVLGVGREATGVLKLPMTVKIG